ncbi:GNAT family N-acetyltransferase [Aquabacter spiritensis]|uniref:N-acetyltransferase domain-containing protein n=1 Tax=Aquabacter spiritensis TaxID=933073 RepID=A0A4R3M4E3_9HYPH|nr:GNAT family N-acetyltransferase [Aquabacter spiritensis]TCT07706.1 hypothetical protein EDC64_101225 [Aquabacter spiritensis]
MDESSDAVRREDAAGHGRYVIPLAPGVEAMMTYRQSDPHMMVIDHTEVPRAFEGRGLAARLVAAAVADARRDGFKIRPLCSYVAAQFRRHPEWEDLRA